MDKDNELVKDLLEHKNALGNATFQLNFSRGKITQGFAAFVRAGDKRAHFLIWGEIATIWSEGVS